MSKHSYHGATSRSYNSWMDPPWRIDLTTHHAMSKHSYHGATSRSYNSSMDPPWSINPTTHHSMSKHSYHGATSHSYNSSMDPPRRIDQMTHTLTTELHLAPIIARWIHHEGSIRRPISLPLCDENPTKLTDICTHLLHTCMSRRARQRNTCCQVTRTGWRSDTGCTASHS